MAKIVAAEYRLRFGFWVVLYLVFLVVPWILTCLQARKPFLLSKLQTGTWWDVQVYGIQQQDAEYSTRLSYILDGFSYVSAILALPAIYAILARAVVVYTLRTGKSKKLNLVQLFQLADRNFFWGLHTQTGFSILATLLIFVAVVHPIVRLTAIDTTWNRFPLTDISHGWRGEVQLKNYTQNSWQTEQVALSPTPAGIQNVSDYNVVTRLVGDLIGSHPNDWVNEAWPTTIEGRRGRERKGFFVSTVPRGTTTGLMRNLALRMDSSWKCERAWGDYPTSCPGGLEYTYRHPKLHFDICLQGNGTGYVDGRFGSPWANTTDRQHITEELYIHMPNIRIPTPDIVDGLSSSTYFWNWNGDLRCTADTEMAYFVLGNDQNNQTHGPKIDRLNETDASIVDLSRTWAKDDVEGGVRDVSGDRGKPYGSYELGILSESPAGGPLTLTARALFGNGSFFDLSQKISPNVTNHEEYSALLAAACPFPLQRHPKLAYDCNRSAERYQYDNYRLEYWDWAAAGVVKFFKQLEGPDESATSDSELGSHLLDSALYLANRAVMRSAATTPYSLDYTKWRKTGIFRVESAIFRQFVIPDVIMVVISALLAVHVLGILGFVCYAYLYPTWTSTLDPLAIARIALQLKDGHLLRAIGLRKPTSKEVKSLGEIDGLIGMVEAPEPIPLSDMSTTVGTSTTRAASGAASPENRNSGQSSVSPTDAQSQHSRAQVVPVVTNDPQMGMSSIPIDVQTVISEDIVDGNTSTNATTNTADNNPSSPRTPTSNLLNAPLPSLPPQASGPRLSLNISDMVPEDDEAHNRPDGPTSPPAYTPRTAEPQPGLMPPSYTSSLAVNELRVGAPGFVTRRNIARHRENVWV